MASDHVSGEVVILFELPDGSIQRELGLPTDPQHNKGNTEILNEIIQYGISGIDWECDGVEKSDLDIDILTLTYVGE